MSLLLFWLYALWLILFFATACLAVFVWQRQKAEKHNFFGKACDAAKKLLTKAEECAILTEIDKGVDGEDAKTSSQETWRLV